MTNFKFERIEELKDAYIITPFYVDDLRGSFEKIFEQKIFREHNLHFSLSETFVSISQKNVLRGLHFQYNQPQTKLVTVLHGACYDVIIDLRKNSSTNLNYKFFKLDDNNHDIIYIPKGYAHGFFSLTDDMCMLYMCDGEYDKVSDSGIVFDDSKLNIKWPIDNINDAIQAKEI